MKMAMTCHDHSILLSPFIILSIFLLVTIDYFPTRLFAIVLLGSGYRVFSVSLCSNLSRKASSSRNRAQLIINGNNAVYFRCNTDDREMGLTVKN